MHRTQKIIPARYRLANLSDKIHKIASAMEARSSLDLYLRLISCWPQPSGILNSCRSPEWTPSAAREWLSDELAATSMMLADARLYMHDDILVKVDRASMAASLELRSPFLDAGVIEFACSLPLSLKIRDGVGKWVVRKVMERYIPPELTARSKMGFAIPLASWLRGPLRDWAESLLHSDALIAGGLVNPVAATVALIPRGPNRAHRPALVSADVSGMAGVRAQRGSGRAAE
jgi:asparagine synthase (glutamine-hydrolysing)